MNLTSEQQKQLWRALISAYPRYEELERMLMFCLEINLALVAAKDGLEDVVFKVIQYFKSRGTLEDLIYKAWKYNPNNPELKEFVDSILPTPEPSFDNPVAPGFSSEKTSPQPQYSTQVLLTAICERSSDLRDYPTTPVVIERPEVVTLMNWLTTDSTSEPLAILAAPPGMGKTVVMQQVLSRLETAKVPTLAIKADYNGSQTVNLRELDQSSFITTCIKQLVELTASRVVVLVDQLDVLSDTFSPNPDSFNSIVETIQDLTNVDHVKIVVSYRENELPSLLKSIGSYQKFSLTPFDDQTINNSLSKYHLNTNQLAPALRTLLQTPLHLSIYIQIIEQNPATQSIQSLQMLYDRLWDIYLKNKAVAPECVKILDKMVDFIAKKRQLTVHGPVLDDYSPQARAYLEEINFIYQQKENVVFKHQTFFDYYYARRFIKNGDSVSQWIFNTPQGLMERLPLRQILIFLKGTDAIQYRNELALLLRNPKLRVHLRQLLLDWLGKLEQPTVEELKIIQKYLAETDWHYFLRACMRNSAWFDILNRAVLPALIEAKTDLEIRIGVDLLMGAINARTDIVLAYLSPHLADETWINYINYCLLALHNWQNDNAVKMLVGLFKRSQALNFKFQHFENLARFNPQTGCLILRIYLDQWLEANQNEPFVRSKFEDEWHVFGKLVTQSAHHCPEPFVEQLLPWFIQAVEEFSIPSDLGGVMYCYDKLFCDMIMIWNLQQREEFKENLITALTHLAQHAPDIFRHHADSLLNSKALAAQQVLVQVYLAHSNNYYDDIIAYLMAEARRLKIGEFWNKASYSARLYGVVFRYLSMEQKIQLRRYLLDLNLGSIEGYKWYAIYQSRFYQQVEPEFLSQTEQEEKATLLKNVPSGALNSSPPIIEAGWVGSPIDITAQKIMTDTHWLKIMQSHEFDDPMGEGGVRELAQGFQSRVQEDADRFFNLAYNHFDETIPTDYIMATISGLAEIRFESSKTCALIMKFTPRFNNHDTRIQVCWAVEKYTHVPLDVLDLLTDWALNDPNPIHLMFNGDLLNSGLNSVRGQAIDVIVVSTLKDDRPQVERVFELLEKASQDVSEAVKFVVMLRLIRLLTYNPARTIAIFLKLSAESPQLLQYPSAYDFLYWTHRYHFYLIEQVIENMLLSTHEATQEAGGRLICLAEFHYPEVEERAKQAIKGAAPVRRGAAKVYARNVEFTQLRKICFARLNELKDDTDDHVCKLVAGCFKYLNNVDFSEVKPFIEEFIPSRAFIVNSLPLVKYIFALPDEHELALSIVANILDKVDLNNDSIPYGLEELMVQLLKKIYAEVKDLNIQSQVMDKLDQLLQLGSGQVREMVKHWDEWRELNYQLPPLLDES